MLPPKATIQLAWNASQTEKFASINGKALQSGCSSMLPPRAKGRRPLEPRYRFAKVGWDLCTVQTISRGQHRRMLTYSSCVLLSCPIGPICHICPI
jgi:hypothetical protein